jgi:hypothetical protein
MATKVHTDRKAKFETLYYAPQLQNSGDLEAATKTINAVAEASGPGNADYAAAMTLPAPDDARLQVLRIGARLSVTIDSLNGGCAHCYCRVYVDVQDADHRLFDLDFTSAANQLSAVTAHAANKAIIYTSLKDGSTHTFYFFFWVDAGNAVLSLAQLWEGVGGNDGAYAYPVVLRLTHSGHCDMVIISHNVLAGASAGYISTYADCAFAGSYPLFLRQGTLGTSPITDPIYGGVIVNNPGFGFHLAANTNLGYLYKAVFMLRSDY